MGFKPRDKGHQHPLSEINMIPFIDIMLVLLIVFIVPAPLLTHAVKIDLPKATSEVAQIHPDTIVLSIKADGSIFWNDQPIGREELGRRLVSHSSETPPPELHIHADASTPYEILAKVMSQAASAGLTKIGFVTEPPQK
jgi:biopolymer transport protein ExbD